MKGDYKKYKVQCKQGSYKTYNEKYKDHPEKLSYKEYRKFFQVFSEEVFEATCKNPDGFELPYFLGVYKIIGAKLVKPLPRTRKYVLKRFRLGATDNYVYSVKWLRYTTGRSVRNIFYYRFVTSRICGTKLYQKILKGEYLNWIKVDSQIEAFKLKP